MRSLALGLILSFSVTVSIGQGKTDETLSSVVAVQAKTVGTLDDLYRGIWGRGAAGVAVPLRLLQGSQVRDVTVRSIDRSAYFRPSKTY